MCRQIFAGVFCMLFALGAGGHEAVQKPVLDAHLLPLGDGKISAAPRRGYVYACKSSFRGAGAQHVGNWIHGSTWDETQKIYVQGDVSWPEAFLSISENNNQRLITGNALPGDHASGIFPVRRLDPAFQIDRNPNAIAAQVISLALPRIPVFANESSCLPMGMVGISLGGVPFFNALDDAGRDAVAHEVQDHCNGHPQHDGEYHYHGPSACLKAMTKNNVLIGYALDGFGIYSMYDEQGKELTNNDLDECHGRVSRILWEGKSIAMYHYVLTREYPYTIGCFRGAATSVQSPQHRAGTQGNASASQAENGRHPGRHRPPDEALRACAGVSSGRACSFVSRRGDTISGICQSPAGELACLPQQR